MTGRGEAARHAKDNATAFAWAAGAEGATVITFTAKVLAAHVAELDHEHSARLRSAIRRTKRTLLMGAALGEKACAEKMAEKNGTVATMVVSDPDQIERLRTLGMGSFGRVFLARLKGAARTFCDGECCACGHTGWCCSSHPLQLARAHSSFLPPSLSPSHSHTATSFI